MSFVRWLYRGIYLPLWISTHRVDAVYNLNYANPVFFDWIGRHKRIVTLYDLIPLLNIQYASKVERFFAWI